MPENQPAVYILHGEDEFSMARFIQQFTADLGDPVMAEMNTTRLDGRSNTLEELTTAVSALPFLAAQRVVFFNHPLERARTPALQKKMQDLLARVPETTRLLLVEDHLLTDKRERDKNRLNWLEKWGLETPKKALVRAFPLPVGTELVRWIQARAQANNGTLTWQAASLLAGQVGPEPRMLEQEIQKLLAYVNYARPVEEDDVQHLTPRTARVADFALVNALRNRDGRQALQVLRRELEEEDPIPLFQRVVTQFRQLLQVREILENKGREDDIVHQLKMHSYAAKLAIEHARRFSMADLEGIYHRLLEVDIAIKTGGMEGELALYVLVTELTV